MVVPGSSKLCAHIIFLFLLPLSFTASFLYSMNLNSASDGVSRKNHEIFHWERKMKDTEDSSFVYKQETCFYKCNLRKSSSLNQNTENVTLLIFMRLQNYQASEKADVRASDVYILIFSVFPVFFLGI